MKRIILFTIFTIVCQANALELEDVYGTWITDADRTAKMNSIKDSQIPPFGISQLKKDPMIIKIDKIHFTSITSVETIKEKYMRMHLEDNSIIKLGFIREDEIYKKNYLKLVNGELHLNPAGTNIIFVLKPKKEPSKKPLNEQRNSIPNNRAIE